MRKTAFKIWPKQIRRKLTRASKVVRKSPRKFASILLIVVFAIVGTYIVVRSQAVIPTGTYTNWNWPAAGTGYWSLEHGLVVEDVTPDATYFWSHQFQIVGGDGGYIGIQSHGNTVSKQVGKTAVFSIFGSGLWGTPGNCETTQAGFDGGLYGAGTSCRITYEWQKGHAYGFKVGITGGDSSGVIWTGTVADFTTGSVTTIGQIKVPTSWKGVGFWSSMWTEYFGGQPATCDKLAYSRVRFLKPSVNGSIAPAAKNNTYAQAGNCQSRITDQADGSTVQEMGTPQPPPAINNPHGWLDEASCDYIGGWAKDNDAPSSPIDVHIYFEQPVGVAGAVGWNIGTANLASSDVGNHRFRRNLKTSNPPINIYDGKVHKVYAYGINIGATGTNTELSMNPRPLSFGPCSAPPTPTPPPPPNQAPTVSISAQSPHTAPATYTVSANASDSNGIASVTFYRVVSSATGSNADATLPSSAKPIGTDTTAPYQITENNMSSGTYTYYAVATDKATAPASTTSTGITVRVNTPPQKLPGDTNGDNKVNIFDLNAVLANWNKTNATLAQGNLNGDSIVNIFDLSMVLSNWSEK